ncbi:hypothetical protein Tco_0106785, partial [Tanacetum coccineum]
FVSTKDWKNMDELMNAALEQEQETKKRERSPPKRRIEQGGSSSKKFKSNETYLRFGGTGYPQCTNCKKIPSWFSVRTVAEVTVAEVM